MKFLANSILLIFSASVFAQSDTPDIPRPTKLESKPKGPPKMELGLALAGQHLNDYRGSKETQLQAYPIPFFIYRGDVIKADRGGLRADFLADKSWELNFSVAGALNGDSENNRLRDGMPELESALEVGPSLNINLTGDSFSSGWQLRVPVRAVFTLSGDGVHHIGYTANPKLTYSADKLIGGWRAKYNLGLFYASDKYHDYYYSVAPEFATENRVQYDAEAGFSGYFFKTTIFKRKKNTIFGVSLQYDNLSGAKFEDSPLVETKDYFSLSFIVAKSFWQKFE